MLVGVTLRLWVMQSVPPLFVFGMNCLVSPRGNLEAIRAVI